MKFINEKQFQKKDWKQVKDIYCEAFPKCERKPFFMLKHSVRTGKVQMLAAMEGELLLGFLAAVPYEDMVMVDYLAVSDKIRSKGTGSRLLQELCSRFAEKKVVLLIERPDVPAENINQRLARRKFYFKNQFTSSGIYINGAGGEMEVLNFGGTVSGQEYMKLQKYALGRLLFAMSGIALASE
jgi:GNAT superfamily N-acetyltransferase